MTNTPTEKPKSGRRPLGTPEQKSRCIRLDDERWKDFKTLLGIEWLRTEIDAAKSRKLAKKTQTK